MGLEHQLDGFAAADADGFKVGGLCGGALARRVLVTRH